MSTPQRGPAAPAPMRTAEGGGSIPAGPGWYVLNIEDAQWVGNGSSACVTFEGDARFGQYGTNIQVLDPGEPNARYHREYYEDESFFVLRGTCVVIVEGEERHLRAGDFVFCPAGTAHVFVGAGDERCAIFMFGARADPPDAPAGCVYLADPVAASHGAAVESDTEDNKVAYAGLADWAPIAEPWWTPA